MCCTICFLGVIKSQLHLQSQTWILPKQQLTHICQITRQPTHHVKQWAEQGGEWGRGSQEF